MTNAEHNEANDIQKATETWDTININQVRDVSWMAVPGVSEHLASLFGPEGTSVVTCHELLAKRYPSDEHSGLKGLALVCGDMASEKHYFYYPTSPVRFAEVTGYDISSVSLSRVQVDFPFNGVCEDVNQIELKPESFDLVVGSHGLHHIKNIKNLFQQTHKALRSNGLITFTEWIGPEYLQIPLRNRCVTTALLLGLFPVEKRTTHMGKVKGFWLQYDPSEFDPSEACNSRQIMPEYEKYFRPLLKVVYGGILYPALEGLGGNFPEPLTSVEKKKINFLTFLDKSLTELGIIQPLFCTTIGEKRS
ncbi:MAG: hypothetical protein DM484_20430 [Candidatus Methylumidiphilus alinenensis]|uniref:Methyltransferase type 11 domain-containing protein n=1 Tax=Candidatus Methylumidiphilus alinenensis TaxID=2202197 RepID=A0A2W4SH39_9GAMM|nr:MAG: hypothetical protein DM484_20430 [Candidatus Methylumidiphilus alinenensis]